MKTFPVFLQLAGRQTLVVGDLPVATRRVEQLHAAGAQVLWIAGDVEKLPWGQEGQIKCQPVSLQAHHMQGVSLVFSASSVPDINHLACTLAHQHGIWAHVADDAQASDFIMPAVVDRSPVMVAISSQGTAPLLARRLKTQLESLLPQGLGALATLLHGHRARVKKALGGGLRVRRFWEALLDGPFAALVLAGRETEAQAELEKQLCTPVAQDSGCVWLVGAGPGDPALLTLRALQVIQQAEVVVYDRLVSPQVLALVRTEAEKINVGKASGQHIMPQSQINALLVKLARQGQRVVRLKGGDPFVFGRGGEEMLACRQAGIPCWVVPGITAAQGCAAAAGIPLTHRGLANQCTWITAHVKEQRLELISPYPVQLNTETLQNQTLVVYMGAESVYFLIHYLLEKGLNAEFPLAIVQKGTTADQKVWVTTLGQMQQVLTKEKIVSPAIIIVGQVVNLATEFQPHVLPPLVREMCVVNYA